MDHFIHAGETNKMSLLDVDLLQCRDVSRRLYRRGGSAAWLTPQNLFNNKSFAKNVKKTKSFIIIS